MAEELDSEMEAPSGEVAEEVRTWLSEIATAKRREKDYRTEGARVKDIYDGNKKDQVPFNILYSNTETLLPALYAVTPRPVVQRRFKDEDTLGKLAAKAGERGLEFVLDTNSEDYAAFDTVIEDVVLDALLPGRGVARWKYEPDIVGETEKIKQGEYLCSESVGWNRVVFGYSRKWVRTPWIAFEHNMDKEESTKLFGEEVADKMVFTQGEEVDADEKDKHNDAKDLGEKKTCLVYEIWDKDGGRKVRYISAHYTFGYCAVKDDPLQLTGFYPMPEPLRFLRKANDQMPKALYGLYENQAKELNRITVRINRIVEALKVRGAYDSTLSELGDILKADDNVLKPAENVAALQDSKGIEHAIWLVPIDKLVIVLQQLIIARQQCKQVIYEITGISDILRGQTNAAETATAQEIKNQWGTLRLKRMQKAVQHYVRDMLRIALEIMGQTFSEETFSQMTGLPYPTTEKKQQATQMLQVMQQSGQPPDPQIAAIAQQPSWGEVIGVLRDDTIRAYRIDIETNSTVDLEATEDQKNMSEALTAIAQYIQGVSPLIENGSMPFEAAQAMLMTIVRRFRFGPELEDAIKMMKPPTPPDAAKAQAEQQKMQMEQQNQQAEMKMKQTLAQQEMQLKEREAQLRTEEMKMELAFKQEEHKIKMAELQQKAQFGQIMSQVKVAEANAKLQIAKQMPKQAEKKESATV